MTDSYRALDPTRGIKPLDFGAAGITGSVDPSGRLIALNTYHPQHGYATLTVATPFPEDERYNPAAVRQYRAGLAHWEGFGPAFERGVTQRAAALLAGAIPQITLGFEDGGQAQVTTWAHGGGAYQRWTLPAAARWRGRLSLQRCAYTQLTEGGPVPMPPTETNARFHEGTLTIENPALGWAAAIAGLPTGETWERHTHGPMDLDFPAAAGTTTLVYAFAPTGSAARDIARALAPQADAALAAELDAWRQRLADAPDDLAVRRGLVYGRMLGVPMAETLCILTDHMLLPLSWNRDAYYVARALLAREPELVRRHLLWMFEVAERPGGDWARCYLANGQVKDAAFQLDQQLFPLLELYEYVVATDDRVIWDRLHPVVERVIETLLARRSPQAWLFPTDETPADDPLPLPYHFSGHVLLWHTLRQIASLAEQPDLSRIADQVRQAVLAHFPVEHDGRTIYAYATDGAGHHHVYHDANDFPLVLAPVWGFTTTDDPVWRATLDFAFSEANQGGYYAGRLGSVHTRAPWSLGDVQDLLIARLLGDAERARRAWQHVRLAAQWDGALPEAYDAQTGAVISRHWFAWPNAALACVALGAFDTSRI